jgi:SAM-dependent methyltransferase
VQVAGLRNKKTDLENVLPPVSELLGTATALSSYTDLDGVIHTIDYRDAGTRDPWPLPMPIDREGYGTVESTPRFWATGLCDWMNVAEACRRHLEPQKEGVPMRLMDFGCASGRFLRHVWADTEFHFEPWGCDFAPENVAWTKRYLPPDIRVLLNHNWPHLPFPDGFFDVVTAFSVFTHIDQFEDAWLLELSRITRPGGLLYLTIQNEATWSQVAARQPYIEHLSKANQFGNDLQISEKVFGEPMPFDRLALRMSAEDVYNCNVWQSNRYVHDHWGRYFEILHIADNGHTQFQSPVLMHPKLFSAADATIDEQHYKRLPR